MESDRPGGHDARCLNDISAENSGNTMVRENECSFLDCYNENSGQDRSSC